MMTRGWMIGLAAFGLAAAPVQAKHGDIARLCLTYNPTAKTLEVEAQTGCLRSGNRFDTNTLELTVDENTATVRVEGRYEVTYATRVGATDCMGSSAFLLGSEQVEPRLYSVVSGSETLGTYDAAGANPEKACLSGHGAQAVRRSERAFAGWKALDAPPPISTVPELIAGLAGGFPETLEGRPELDSTLRTVRWTPRIVAKPGPPSTQGFDALELRLTQSGLQDDSVRAVRYAAILRQTDDGWQVWRLYRQSLCARGKKAGQWNAASCP